MPGCRNATNVATHGKTAKRVHGAAVEHVLEVDDPVVVGAFAQDFGEVFAFFEEVDGEPGSQRERRKSDEQFRQFEIEFVQNYLSRKLRTLKMLEAVLRASCV